jgi:hypothetical protein
VNRLGYKENVCRIAPIGAGVSLVAFIAVWVWVSHPVWWDPFFRDAEAQRAFRARVAARKRALLLTGVPLALFVLLAGLFRC